MKTPAKLLSLFAATCLVCAGVSRAQLVTYETVSTYNGGGVTPFNGSGTTATRAEVFDNMEAINSVTFNFFKGGVSSTSASFNATFAEWNTSTSTWDTLISAVPFTVPNSSSWTTLTNSNGTFATYAYTYSFGGNYITDPTATYALLLTNTSGSATNFGLGSVFDAFAYGSSGYNPAPIGPIESGEDYIFSQIVLVPGGNVVPVPESSTVAAILAAVFVASLFGLRIYRRRQQLAVAPLIAS